jgi:tetratricopeptide (TPR) repeat protein
MSTTAKILVAITLCLTSSLLLARSDDATAFQTQVDKIISGFNTDDPKPFNQAVNADRILETAFSDMLLTSKWERDFKVGLKLAMTTQLGKKIIAKIPDGAYVKLLRLKPEGNTAKALIRFDYGDNGNAYMDLHLAKDTDGKVSIVNWYDYSSGQLYSESIRQITATLSPTPTMLGKLFDFASNRKADMDQIVKLIKMNKEGKYKELVNEFISLDESLRKSRFLNIIAVQAANHSNDMKLYGQALANLEKYFANDPSMTFLLLDYYFIGKQYGKVLKALDQVQKSFGVEDASITFMKSNTYLMQNNFPEAIVQAKHAIELEPEYEDSYWALINAQIPSKQYRQAVATARILEDQFGYDMGPQSLGSNEAFVSLSRSAEYKKWRSTK